MVWGEVKIYCSSTNRAGKENVLANLKDIGVWIWVQETESKCDLFTTHNIAKAFGQIYSFCVGRPRIP